MGVTGGAPDLPNIFVCRAGASSAAVGAAGSAAAGPARGRHRPGPRSGGDRQHGGEAGVEVAGRHAGAAIQVDTPTGTQTLKLIGPRPCRARRQALTRVRMVGTPVLWVFGFGLVVWWLVGRAVAARRAAADRGRRHQPLDARRALPEPAALRRDRRLARTMNGMLGRLQAGTTSSRRLVSDASHELRTPVAVMRAELDVAQRSAEPDWPATAVVLQDELGRLQELVDDLLLLARADEQSAATRVSISLRRDAPRWPPDRGGGDTAHDDGVAGNAGRRRRARPAPRRR